MTGELKKHELQKYLNYFILYEHGGILLNWDSIVLQSFEEIMFWVICVNFIHKRVLMVMLTSLLVKKEMDWQV